MKKSNGKQPVIDNYDCVYCGMPATDRDHVRPHSYDSVNKKRDFPFTKIVMLEVIE